MGVAITELLVKKEIEIDSLKGKIICIDAPLFLYQFLTTIRSRDGSLLMDSKGNVTSHLTGLFTRTANLMQKGLKLVYVFDGKVPDLKKEERAKRRELKLEAAKKFEEAKKKEDLDEMKKYAARTSRLTGEMIEEAQKLIKAFGIPVVDGASEGEAQAAYIVKNNDAYAVASQDADCLMFGAPRLIRNLSIAGKKKKANVLSYEKVMPEFVDLSENLNNLGIDNDQLIALGMLVGTDYNNGGIKGIGPKNALKLVKQYGKDFDSLFKDVKWNDYFGYPWQEVFNLIKNMGVKRDYELKWHKIDIEKIKELLVEEHDFSHERVESVLGRFKEDKEEKKQKGLGEFM